jgi:hypothetical protein
LDNAGAATWTGAGRITLANGAVINNLAAATFLVQANAPLSSGSGSPGTFNNLGIFRKLTSSGTTTSSVVFTNASTGTVDVQSGTLNLFGGGTHDGTFTVGAETILAFGGRNSLSASSHVSGTGQVAFTVDGSGTGVTTISGSYTLTGSTWVTAGTVNFLSDVTFPSLYELGGTYGGSGNVTVSGLLTWLGGTMAGPGRTEAMGNMQIGSNTAKALDGRTLNSHAITNWTGAAGIDFSNAAVFNNASGATFNAQSDATLRFAGGNPVAFNNAGAFQKSQSSGMTTLGVPFQNGGTVDIQTGTLLASGGGVSGGTFTVDAGGTLQFAGPSYLLNGTSQVTGAGNVTFGIDVPTGGNTTVAGTYNVGNTTINAGTVSFLGNASTGTSTVGGGVLAGLGTLTVSGPLTWTGGTMSDAGRTVANGDLTIGGAAAKFLDTRALDNTGTATWTGTGDIRASHGATLNNRTGAVFEAQNNANFTSESGSAAALNNAGTFTKSASTATTHFDAQFNNTGTVNVETGTLELAGGGTSSGNFSIAAGSSVKLSQGIFTFTGGTATDSGSISAAGATLLVQSPVTFQNLSLTSGSVAGTGTLFVTGTMSWTGGTMSGAGFTTIRASAALSISEAGQKMLSRRTLNNSGTVTWTDAGGLTLSDGAAVHNLAGGLFDVRNDQPIDGGTTQGTFTNTGTLRKSGGSGTTTVADNVALTNTGTVDVGSGTLFVGDLTNLSGTTLTGGTFVVSSTLEVGNGDLGTLAAAVVLDGPTSVVLDLSGADALANLNTITAQGSFTIQNGRNYTAAVDLSNVGTLNIGAGSTFTAAGAYTQPAGAATRTVTGAGDLVVNGLLTWTAGEMSGTGQTTANGGLTLSGIGFKNLTGRTFNNAGLATWTAGIIYATLDSVFNNLSGATLDSQADTSFLGNGDTTPVFNNQGLFLKSAGTGVTQFQAGIVFNNAGTVEVDSGTVSFKTGGTHVGSFTGMDGTTLAFLARTVAGSMDEHDFLPGSSIISTGTVQFESGPSNILGTYSASTTQVRTDATVTFADGVNLNDLTLFRGTMMAAGNLTIAGLFNWDGGTLAGTGQITSGGGMLISNSVVLSGATLSNGGSAIWTGPGFTTLANGAVFNNMAGSTCDVQGDRTFRAGSGVAPSFINAGTFIRSTSGGTAIIALSFTNNGTVLVQAGTLFLSGPFTNFSGTTLTGGTFVVQGVLQFNNANVQTNAATLVLDGPNAQVLDELGADALAQFATNDVGGSFTLTDGSAFTAAASFTNRGNLTIGPGSVFTVTGDYSQSPTATLEVQISACPDTGQFGQLVVAGQASLAGTLTVTLLNGFVPQVGDSYQVLTFGTRTGDFDTISGLDLGNDLRFNPVYDDTSLSLVAVSTAPL